MALEGAISDFGLADIFQLISLQKKAGELILSTDELTVTVLFENGMIVSAETTSRDEPDRIGRILVRTKKISEKQLKEILKTQKKKEKRIGHILLDAGLISESELKEVLQLQLAETVLQLFAWKAGKYSFNQKEISYDKDLITPVNTEFILMEGIRMVDEWPLIEKNIPSLKIIFTKSDEALPNKKELKDATGLEDIFFALDDEPASSFSKEEEAIFGLIDGFRDVQEIIDLSKLGHFETCKILSNLYTNGTIKKVKEQVKSKTGFKLNLLVEIKELFTPSLKYLNYALIIAILIYLASYLRVTESLAVNYYSYKEGAGYLNEYIVRSRINSIRFALETYYYENGDYPRNLNILFEQKFLFKKDLIDTWGREYNYELLPQKAYKIYSSGIDGRKGTADDIE